jgi:hypothetical protein
VLLASASYRQRDVDDMAAQAQASPASPSVTSEVDGGVALDGGVVRVRGSPQEGARCGAAMLEKAMVGGPCDGEDERHCFFRSREALKPRSGVGREARVDGRPALPTRVCLFPL